ncbi:HEPN domain-containing protein [Fibrella aquatilis]|uniref:HEPN domain-containing protein n=1 Tax=Fibrella aquatilis TaxID=2817059 RepID=A0A939G4H8_9BACT|nr:HEPN domain-containing protein [Fibrella aquatilis]MBO0931741.1 HEPN domain-containing protein [Fibrella aquatilis]
MNEDALAYLHKADECLIDCQILVREGRYEAACNRAYYAFFDAIRALLATKLISINSHSAAQSLFGLHFVKPGLFNAKYSRDVNRLMEKRQGGDYELDIVLSQADAEDSLQTASEFNAVVRQYVNSLSV